jgi:thiamine biosynthesis lipoprotein
VPPELEALLVEVDDWSWHTAGAFDPRVGALVDAWGLRGSPKVPDSVALGAALRASGAGAIDLDGTALVRHDDAAWIDSGGFGKGAALRWAARSLTEASTGDDVGVLLDLGGQILALGPVGVPWTVGVAHPDRRADRVATLRLQGVSAATTGSSERGLHVLDPRTGSPVEAWGSVTVVADDPLAADVLSTALYVMGPRDGLAWAQRADVAALFLESIDGSVRATWTAGLEPWLVHAPTVSAPPQPTRHERNHHEP